MFALLSQGNVLVVTELIHGGSLENLLRAPGERNNYHNVCCKLNDRQLVTVAFQIAMGMQHLEERKVRPAGSVQRCRGKFSNLPLEMTVLKRLETVDNLLLH